MIEFIIMLIFFFILVDFLSVNAKPVTKSACPPHKWDYNQEDRIQCHTCKRYPGVE